jgi:hypothetical protein
MEDHMVVVLAVVPQSLADADQAAVAVRVVDVAAVIANAALTSMNAILPTNY